MATFITRLDEGGTGVRLAVKDLIDVEGVPTTAGCKALAGTARPADADAPVVALSRANGARIVGKANLHELAFGATGVNPWFGTPRNPIDPALVPGGSSSGSAVAVATDEADVAWGTDTAGSVRIPSACCGTVGLKTTYGRVPAERVWPLSQSLDTVGPMAADVAGVVRGMQLVEPEFRPGARPTIVGRLRGVSGADPAIDAAVDRALASAGFEVVDVELAGWYDAIGTMGTIIVAEAWANDRTLVERDPDGVAADVRSLLQIGATINDATVGAARGAATRWRDEMAALFGRVEVIATPTLGIFPPRIDGDLAAATNGMTVFTAPVNVAGNPALALPVPSGGPVPASIQLIGPHGGEEALVAAGAVVEAAVQ